MLGLIALGVLVWFFLFRDTSAASVDSVAAAEAREEAIAQAAEDAAQEAEPEPGAAAASEPEASDTTDGQPDSAASAGSPADGVWTVDTSIGAFDDACLDVACSSTFVGFRINEELISFGAKTVVGRTPGVTGSVTVAGSQITEATFVADMSSIVTDDNGRTAALKSAAGGLETATFPEATFILAEAIELGQVPVEGASIEVSAVGDLTVHGTTQRVTIPLTAELQAGLVVIFGSLVDMELADYGIPKPTSVVVLSVEEVATMELQIFLSR